MLLQADSVSFGYGYRPQAPGPGKKVSRGLGPGARGLVLDDVSLSVPAGGLVGILGPNGSGKTTLLRLLAGALTPLRGEVRLDGTNIVAMPRGALARRSAMVPQETHLAFEYSVLEIVLMGRYPHLGAFEVEGPDDIDCALAALGATGTRHLAERAFHTLSGGEKQRVIIASALAQLADTAPGTGHSAPSTPPRLLFLDEPTASLDLRYQIEVAQLIRTLHRDRDIAIVLSTHDLHLAAAVCDEVVLLSAGRVLAHGPTQEMLTEARVAELYQVDPDRFREFRRSAVALQ